MIMHHAHQCKVFVNLLLSHKTGYWYLSTLGHLRHEYHTCLADECKSVRERDCDPEDVDLMHVMYSVDTPPATIAKIMEEVRRKKGQTGQFLTKNIRNASSKHKSTMDHLKGIDKHWTTAKKVITNLAA